jgi:hypothetical protein
MYNSASTGMGKVWVSSTLNENLLRADEAIGVGRSLISEIIIDYFDIKSERQLLISPTLCANS